MIAFLIKSTIVIAVLLAFYKLVLERESYFTANRWYLIATLVFACTLPFISLPRIMENQGSINQLLVEQGLEESGKNFDTPSQLIPTDATMGENSPVEYNSPELSKGEEFTESSTHTGTEQKLEEIQNSTEAVKSQAKPWNWTAILIGIYLFGMGIFIVKLLFEVTSTLYKAIRFPDKIEDDQATIVNMAGEVAPCSFFRFVFINPAQYDFETYEQILEHEKIHVRKGHSMDLLLAELLVAISWFNPLAWLLRKEIEKNIEYQTDDLLVRGASADRESYQLNLVKVASPVRPLAITTNYNQSLIKQRILKMNNKRSNPFGYWKYTFVAPLVFAMLVLLNEPGIGNVPQTRENKSEPVSSQQAEPKPATKQTEPVAEEAKTPAEQAEPVTERTGEPTAEAEEFTLPKNDCGLLNQASREGNIEQVKELLKSTKPNCIDPDPGYDVIYQNGYRWQKSRARTPLSAAARHGYLEIAKLLIDAGAEADFDTGDHGSPMTEAAGGGYIEMLTLFMENGGEVNERSQGQGSPLIAAARNGQNDALTFLLDKGARINYQNDGSGSALNAAARNGHLETAKLLLENGASINAQNDGQGSALNAAARNGYADMVKFLIEQGTEVDAQTSGQGTALNAAARNGHVEAVTALLEAGANIDRHNDGQGSALNAAARNGHTEMVKLLLDKGANIDRQNDGQGSPLNAAARNNHVETMQLLIDRGAEVDMHNDGQGSPLNAAARNGHVEAAKVLLKAGAAVDRQTDGQGSPLNAAARNGHDEMVEFLLDQGADIDRQNDGQGSALNAAARNGHIRTAKLLIEKGANVNRQNDGQGSPLNAAARNGHLDMVKLLIENGARVNQFSSGQGTALSAASRNRHRSVVKYLIDQGADR